MPLRVSLLYSHAVAAAAAAQLKRQASAHRMAIRIASRRVLWLSVAFAAPIAGFAALAATSQPAVPQALTCVALPSHLTLLSKPLTIAQVEEESVKELSNSPGTPELPYGHINAEWKNLKSKIELGDTLHAYATDVQGGHLVLRKGCVVGQITSWIR